MIERITTTILPLLPSLPLLTWESLEAYNLEEALSKANLAPKLNELVAQYNLTSTVYHIPTTTMRSVYVKVFINMGYLTAYHQLDKKVPLTKMRNLFAYTINLYTLLDSQCIGTVSLVSEKHSNNIYTLGIRDLWNLLPHIYHNVGSTLMQELISSIIYKSTHFHNATPTFTTNTHFNFLRKTWHQITNSPTTKITLSSVFQAIVFYDKLGFDLSYPDNLILSHPYMPCFIKYTEKQPEKEGRMEFCFETINAQGMLPMTAFTITTNFENGKPISSHWRGNKILDDVMSAVFDINDEEEEEGIDFDAFKVFYPDTLNFMVMDKYKKSAEWVLETEKSVYRETRVKRFGHHGAIEMVLNRERYESLIAT